MTATDSEDLLAQAVSLLTEAWRQGRDVAEFAACALTHAAANADGVESLLGTRSGSWEADLVRQLVTGTAGHDLESLRPYRTVPIRVGVYADELLIDTASWKPYDDVITALYDEQVAAGLIRPATTAELEALDGASPTRWAVPLTDEQAEQADRYGAVTDATEDLREQDLAAYGAALREAILARATELGITNPVDVVIDLDTYRDDAEAGYPITYGLADDLRAHALDVVVWPHRGEDVRARAEALATAREEAPTTEE